MVDAERVILRTKHPVYTWWFYVLCTSWTSSKTRHSGSLPSIPRNAPAWPSIFYLPIDQLVPRCYPAGSQDFDGFWGIIRMNCASCGKQVYNFSCHTPCGWWITSFQTWSFFASGTTHIFIWWVVDLQLWKIWKSVGIIIPNIWKVIKAMFQTTNQLCLTGSMVQKFKPLPAASQPNLNHFLLGSGQTTAEVFQRVDQFADPQRVDGWGRGVAVGVQEVS